MRYTMERSYMMLFMNPIAPILFLLWSTSSCTGDMIVVDSGYEPLELNSMALVVYVTVVNPGEYQTTVYAEMNRCCIKLDQDGEEFDCESLRLVSHGGVMIGSKTRVNLTLVWPNMYVTDRLGECSVNLHENGSALLQHVVKFDTRIPASPEYHYWLPSTLQAFVFGVAVRDCESIDEDRLRQCEPVNCRFKYSGVRNFWNKTRRRCETVVECLDDPDTKYPSKVYLSDTNQCVPVKRNLTKTDLDNLNDGQKSYDEETMSRVSDFECVHGVVTGGRCVCNDGWTNRYLDPNSAPYEQATVYCDVMTENGSYTGIQWDTRAIVILCLVGTVVTLLLVLTMLLTYEWYITKQALDSRNADIKSLHDQLGQGHDDSSLEMEMEMTCKNDEKQVLVCRKM